MSLVHWTVNLHINTNISQYSVVKHLRQAYGDVPECAGERILEIGHYSTMLESLMAYRTFLWTTPFILAISAIELIVYNVV